MVKHVFTIVVPVYNEKDNLLRLEKALLEFVKTTSFASKVLFVDDGSTDGSQSLLTEICDRNSEFSFIAFSENFGLSAALKAGFDYVDTELLGYIDADLQTTPKDFNLLLPYVEDFDLVTGVRVNRKDTYVKALSSKIANAFRKLFTHDDMDDTGCPLKIIRTSCAKKIPMFRGLHRFLPALILLQNGRVKQVPIMHFSRIAGKSKFGLSNRILGPFIDCFVFLWMKKRYINYKLVK